MRRDVLRYVDMSDKPFFEKIKSFWMRIASFFSFWRLRAAAHRLPEPAHVPRPVLSSGPDMPKQDARHPSEAYSRLKVRFRDVGRMSGVIEALGRDFLTAMPEGAYKSRLGQISFLFRRMHEDLIDKSVYEDLEEAINHETSFPGQWDEWDRANLREMEALYLQFCHVAPELWEKKASMSYEGRRVHREVLAANDWEAAKDFLQEQIDLHKAIASARRSARPRSSGNDSGHDGEDRSLYQYLLEEHMPGMTVAEVERLFDGYEKEIEQIIPAVLERQKKSQPPVPLRGHFAPEAQLWINKALLKVIGFDFSRGGLYETGHNPVEGGTPDDTRLVIKTADSRNFLDSMKSTLHEGGHGLYIQGLPRKEWRYQPVAADLGAMVQESQALLVEMIIGRMPEFFAFLSPRLEGLFQGIGDPDLQAGNLYALKTHVQPTVDRKNADEVTYFQHVLVRFYLERDLIEGRLTLDDLPDAWAEKMQKYIGVVPKTPAEGCLQDVHWFVGKFGYFPAYALGHMMAAQIYQAMERDFPDIRSQVLRGRFDQISTWLREKIHSQGRLIHYNALLKDITGEELSWKPLLTHIQRRYLKLS